MAASFNYKDILNEIARNDGTARQITEDESEKLKSCLLEMAADIDLRCRKNGIHLFLVGGSLLGAVRHQGFIPWDDDMDFGLLREEYEKLKTVFDAEFGDCYELRCPNSGRPNGNRFMQVFKKGTVLKTVGDNNPFCPQNVYLDIFPYDYVPENRLLRRLKGLYANALMFLASCVMDERTMDDDYRQHLRKSKNGAFFLKLRSLTGKAFSWRMPEKWFDRVDDAIRNPETSLLTSATGRRHYFGEIYPAEVFLTLTELPFEGHYFYAPAGWAQYLEGNYGPDYMIPPAEGKRESHFITELSL